MTTIATKRIRLIWTCALATMALLTTIESWHYLLSHGSRGRFHAESRWFIYVTIAAVGALYLHSRSSPRQATAPAMRLTWWTILFTYLVLAWIIYLPAVWLGYLSDDFVLLAQSKAGTSFVIGTHFWRPLPLLIFRVGDAAGGPWILHTTNILLHAANAWLLNRLARVVGFGDAMAFAAGLAFLSFPAALEAVAWVSGLQDVLMTTAVLAGLWAWLSRGHLGIRILVVVVSLALALAAKETAIVMPVLGVVISLKRLTWRTVVFIAAATAVVVLSYALYRLSAAPLPQDYSEAPSRWLAKELLVRSFGGLALPYHVDLRARLVISLLMTTFFSLTLGLAAISWSLTAEGVGRAIQCALWVPLAVVPVYTYFFISADLQGSRYLYLASAGWSLFLAALFQSACGLGRRLPPFAAAALLCLFALSHAVIARSQLTLWTTAAGLRDAVLRSASGLTGRCNSESTFVVPDSVGGAYVFRNGFPEALQSLTPHPGADGVPCRLRWNGEAFEDGQAP